MLELSEVRCGTLGRVKLCLSQIRTGAKHRPAHIARETNGPLLVSRQVAWQLHRQMVSETRPPSQKLKPIEPTWPQSGWVPVMHALE